MARGTSKIPAFCHHIRPTAVYSKAGAMKALRLKEDALKRAVRDEGLRVARRNGRNWFLGEWLLEWLRAGEVVRQPERNGRR